jgi:hypothetical protein
MCAPSRERPVGLAAERRADYALESMQDHWLRSHLFKVLLALGATLVVGACGSKSKGAENPTNTGGDDASAIPTVDATLCETAGKNVQTFDLDKDNKPDVWKLFKKIEEGGTPIEVLTCKQVDFDHDGAKDYVAAYNKKGGMIFEKADFDYDGKFDMYAIYDLKSGKLVEVERDSGFDGNFDLKELYDKEGGITSVRRDRNSDGDPDVWEQYVDGALVAILYDDDYDNKVDRREEVPGSRPKSNLPPPEPMTPTPEPEPEQPNPK